MQNKPNPQTIKINLTLSFPMSYNNKPPRPTRKNKPNSNPIKPNPTAPRNETNPIQTHSNPSSPDPTAKSKINHPVASEPMIMYPNHLRRCGLCLWLFGDFISAAIPPPALSVAVQSLSIELYFYQRTKRKVNK